MEDQGISRKNQWPEENDPLCAMGSSAKAKAKLRQVDGLVSQGRSVSGAVRLIGVTQFTDDRWRKEFGGLKTDQVKRLKERKSEASNAIGSSEMPNNKRPRKAVAGLTREKLILRGERRPATGPSARANASGNF